jgi:hypothetical protein
MSLSVVRARISEVYREHSLCHPVSLILRQESVFLRQSKQYLKLSNINARFDKPLRGPFHLVLSEDSVCLSVIWPAFARTSAWAYVINLQKVVESDTHPHSVVRLMGPS